MQDRILWFAALFLVIYVITNNQEKFLTLPEDIREEAPALIDAIKNMDFSNPDSMAELMQKFYGDDIDPFSLSADMAEGKGAPAMCGHEVKLHYKAYNNKGDVVKDTEKSAIPLSFTLGDKTVSQALENRITGMKKGGVRQVTMYAEDIFSAEEIRQYDIESGAPVGLKVRLLDISEKRDESRKCPNEK